MKKLKSLLKDWLEFEREIFNIKFKSLINFLLAYIYLLSLFYMFIILINKIQNN